MKKKTFSFLACILICGAASAEVGIVLPEQPTQIEEMAAKELSEHFELATGRKHSIVKGESENNRKIYIGKHAKIRELLGASVKFEEEEWLVQAFGKDTLVITGGFPRGVLYGVYEFLENNQGVLWMDEKSTFVPRTDDIVWKADLRYSGKPTFPVRGVYTARGTNLSLRHRFLARNRMNHFHDERFTAGEAWDRGVRHIVGSPRSCHTFYDYTKDWGKEQEKFFSWSSGQKKYLRAVNAYGPGQVCMSNPETVHLFTEQLRKYILDDKTRYGKDSAPRIYVISPNDNIAYCECGNCNSLVKKYGNQAGVLLSFVNALAKNIEPEFPDVTLMTTAYVSTKELPKDIVLNKNVIIQAALLGREFSGERRDTHRSFTHSVNRESADLIQQWKTLAPLAVWDYWVLYHDRGLYPATNALNIADNLRFYRSNKVRFIFAECAGEETTSLHALRLYLGMRMMTHAETDPEKEISRFMNAYYGKAAPYMRKYHDLLRAGNTALNGSLCDIPLNRRTDLNDDFFRNVLKWFDEAEKAEAGNPAVLERVGRERISVDRALLDKRHMLAKDLVPDPEAVMKRLKKNYTAAVKRFIVRPKQKTLLDQMDMYAQSLNADIPPLKGFEDKQVIADCTWPVLAECKMATMVDDPEAAGGKALGMNGKEGRTESERKSHLENRGISCGVYDFHNRKSLVMGTIPAGAVPHDEKYHWYCVGRFDLAEKSFIWMHWSWLCQLQLGRIYDPSGLNNQMDVYVSIKVCGPNYVQGSNKPNLYAIDRVVVCRASNGKDPAMSPLPAELQDRKCVFEVSGMALGAFRGLKAVFDPESATRTALRLGKQSTHAGRPLMIGIYDETGKKILSRIQPGNMPRDEKYHPYSLGVHRIPASGYLFAHVSCLLRVDLQRLRCRTESEKEYEIVAVVKTEGPSYVPGSAKEDAVSLERILLLEPKK